MDSLNPQVDAIESRTLRQWFSSAWSRQRVLAPRATPSRSGPDEPPVALIDGHAEIQIVCAIGGRNGVGNALPDVGGGQGQPALQMKGRRMHGPTELHD